VEQFHDGLPQGGGQIQVAAFAVEFHPCSSKLRGMNFKLLFGAVLLLITLTFTVQNAAAVDVKFLGWKFSTSLALVIFVTLASGFIGGWAITSALRLKSKMRSA
jgi:uncharacterized integral membrane protein